MYERGTHTATENWMDWPLASTMLSKPVAPWPCDGGPGFWTNEKRREDDSDGRSGQDRYQTQHVAELSTEAVHTALS